MHILKTVGVSRSFGKFTAVNAVDLHILATGIHALIGPNGAGKSTLLNLLAGTLPVSVWNPVIFASRFGQSGLSVPPPPAL